MAKRTFINELGREITIEVEKGALEREGKVLGPFLKYTMTGPDSTVENTVTGVEAAILAELLQEEGFGGIRVA